jgi:PIN domain nuclease of toxin-antitoxin system
MFLLDTCTLIWLGSGSTRLPERVRSQLTEGVVKVSEISRIEIVIKEAKLGSFGVDFDGVIAKAGIDRAAFPVDAHRHFAALPDHHKDPFDRMLIAHALFEGLTLVTCDTDIRRYDVPTFW